MVANGDGEPPLVALLGPTNTGKTHRAIERMLSHDSGMIGLPLRLLAREVYDRVSLRIGEHQVALVTGEEKRVPPRPRYWVCTVEAMPIDLEVDFLAVDEIQLAGNRQRGHVFTERLLHARGRVATWFLGAGTMRPLIAELVPTATIRTHARLSRLSGVGAERIGELRPRTAVVAFSMAKVYEIAERLRARRGGAAVVLGALSPRARNAQVALYQSGEVDYLVATDAIGMGLNLDLDHVAFAELTKFDGRARRVLSPAELAQVAGRAGRHENDGTFGTLAPLPAIDHAATRAIETHRFPAVERLWWRNHDLDTGSIAALITSLRRRPSSRALRLDGGGDDFEALLRLRGDPLVERTANSSERVELLWQVCQVPDYRQLMLEDHVGLLRDLFRQLTGPRQRLDPDWITQRITSIDRTDGGIDDLLMRMAFVRTWTYVSHRSAWLDDATGWQERTRAIEDRLSDALHAALVDRFIDRPAARGARLAARSTAPPGDSPFASLAALFGHAAPVTDDPAARIGRIIDAPFGSFEADASGLIAFDGTPLARLSRGVDLAHPDVVLLDRDFLGRAAGSQLQRRLVAWSRDLLQSILGAAGTAAETEGAGPVRAILHLLERGLGTVAAADARASIRALGYDDRTRLARLGVHLGRRHLFIKSALKPRQVARRAALAAAHWGVDLGAVVPPTAAVSTPADDGFSGAIYTAIGFPRVGPLAVRADILDRLDGELRRGANRREFQPTNLVARHLGCRADAIPAVLAALGYAVQCAPGR